MNISLDGYCDHTMTAPTEELMDYFTGTMDDVDLLFYGRIMYELMFPYWADVARDQSGTPAENRFADRLCEIDSVVISTSLTNVNEKARIVRGNPVEELRKLKQLPGKTISIDTVSMLPELINAGLIDEFHLVVHPIIAGNGRHLLNAGSLQQQLQLKLIDTRTFESGCIALHYAK
jgi:dihydrofolate reductase